MAGKSRARRKSATPAELVDSAIPGQEAAPLPPMIFAADADPALSRTNQTAYLHLLTRGASPAAACQQLGCSIHAVLRAIQEDDEFAKRIDQANRLLSQNVAAALYRSAMQGSVSAQTFYLKHRPPPDWPQSERKGEAVSAPADGLDDLSDEELAKLYRSECSE